MTLADAQKAALALFAARQAGPEGSLEEMKAICYIMRNRVRAGWHDGSWMRAIEAAEDCAGNVPWTPFRLEPERRAFQRLLQDIDGIYYGSAEGAGWDLDFEQSLGAQTVMGVKRPALLYWCWVDREMTQWFQRNIIGQPKEHDQRAQLGSMLFFE